MLAAVLVLGVLAGCQSGGNKGTEQGYSEETEENGNADSGTGDDEAANKESDTEKTGDEAEESKYVIPEVTMEKYDIPDTEDFRFVKDMKIGFSLGNTFDAYVDGSSLKDDMDTET